MEQLISNVIERLSHVYPGSSITCQIIQKNNGIKMHGIAIMKPGEKIAPTIYIDKMYEDGLSVDDIIDYIIDGCENGPGSPDWTANISNYDTVKDLLTLRLVNYELNKNMLGFDGDKTPYIKHKDLAIIVKIALFESNGETSTKVTNDMLKMWGKGFEEVYGVAKQHFKEEKTVITKLFDLLPSKMQTPEVEHLPMYILSNERNLNGSVRMLDEDALRKFADAIDSDLIILPSSIHEVILCPDYLEVDANELRNIVKMANATCVDPQEVLSDSVYYFKRNEE